MKTQILSLLVLLALFGFTATGAEAHTVHGFHGHGHGHFHHHHYFNNGQWYDYDDDCDLDCVAAPGFVIHINL